LGTRGLSRSTEGVESIRKSINGISVVEWLGTKHLEKELGSIKRRAIINVGIRLDNPDEFLDRVVEVELDLVRGRTDRFVTSELNLLNQILVRVLCHLSALIRIKEDIVNIKRSSNKRLLVSSCDWDRTSGGSKVVNSPETLANWADIKVNLDFVILYESLIPLLSEYLSAFSHTINYYYMKIMLGTRLYLKLSLKRISLLKPITI
jgi:hypothetical protein